MKNRISKRRLLALLAAEVEGWTGKVRPGWRQRRRLRRIMALLGRCTMMLAEQSRLELCRLWFFRAENFRRPDTWLREVWLADIAAWRLYLDQVGCREEYPMPEWKSLREPLPERPYLPFPRPLC